MALTLIDTSLLIDYLAGVEPASASIVRELETGNLATTSLARAELLAAARTPRLQNQLRQLLNSLTTLPLDEESANHAAELVASASLPLRDALLAGIAMMASARLMIPESSPLRALPGVDLVYPDGSGPRRHKRQLAES